MNGREVSSARACANALAVARRWGRHKATLTFDKSHESTFDERGYERETRIAALHALSVDELMHSLRSLAEGDVTGRKRLRDDGCT